MDNGRTPWALLADFAAGYLGEREVSRNQSPFLQRVWRLSGIGDWGYVQRQPWCAVFVAYCIAEVSRVDRRLKRPFPPTASVLEFVERSRNFQIPCLPWQDARKGDVVTFLPHFSHIGIVEERVASGLITIEGNTNPQGSREGDGVYRRERKGSLCAAVWALPVGLL